MSRTSHSSAQICFDMVLNHCLYNLIFARNFKNVMKNLSSLLLFVFALGVSINLSAQTPVVPPVSSGTLESLGFDSAEIDAIMGTSGVSTSVDAASQIQDAQQTAVQNAMNQEATLAPNTSSIPPAVVAEVIAEATDGGSAPAASGRNECQTTNGRHIRGSPSASPKVAPRTPQCSAGR